jgi:hypothetical protein
MKTRATGRWVQTREAIQLPEKGLRIAAVADSHGNPHPRTHELLRALAPDHILHAGDVGDLSVLDPLREIAPLIAVRGNIDGHEADLPDGVTIDVCEGDRPLLTMLLLHIALYGPKLRADALKRVAAERASIVVCGHSHVPFLGRHGAATIMNPGSIGPRRFTLPILFGVIEIDRARVTMRHVSCETGETWMP